MIGCRCTQHKPHAKTSGEGLHPHCSSADGRAEICAMAMLDLREIVHMRGEGDDADLSSFEVKMLPKLQFPLSEEF